MFIENYQSGDALSLYLDSRLNSSSLLRQLPALMSPCTRYFRHQFGLMGDGELTPAYFMLDLRLVFSRL
jgi:hypothetical protein